MSVEANKKAGIIHQSTLPHPTSIATAKSKAEEKPKSIVNPVQRVSPLMATTTSTAANPSNQQHNRPQNVEARGRQNRPAAAAVLRQDRAPRTTQKITTEKRKC
jgi:hypothetical protein